MGNCCGKESGSGGGGILGGGNNFHGQGRTLGDAPARQAAAPAANTIGGAKASIPANVASTPRRTLGGSSGEDGNAKSAAAAAAEARANKVAGTDKLSQNLAAQKKAGMKGALEQAAEENRRTREIDQSTQERNWS